MILSTGATSYLGTALWSTTGFEDDCENLDNKYCISDISEEFKEQAQKDYDSFYALAQNLFEENELDFEQIGHDFWLTRNGHGAGFWDGDYVNGDAITAIVKKHFLQNDDELRDSITNEEAA